MSNRGILTVSEGDAKFKVTHLATEFKDKTKIYVPYVPFEKLKPGFELNKKLSNYLATRTLRGKSMNKEENIDRSTRRARQQVKNLINNNDFQLFATLTVDPKLIDRSQTELVKAKLHSWLKAAHRKYPDFAYVIIPELHKDGKIHFHALFANYPDIAPAYNQKYEGQMVRKGRPIYNIPSLQTEMGFTDVEQIESQGAVAKYVMKYITKDMPTFADKKRYWYSRNLKPPTKLYNVPYFDPSNPAPTDRRYSGEYGFTYVYDKGQLPLKHT